MSDPATPPQADVACPHCDTPLPAAVAFCPACGRSIRPLPRADRTTAALSYLTLVPAVALLLLPAFRGNRFVRFHAWQSVLVWAVFLFGAAMAVILSNITFALTFLVLGILAAIAMFFLWLVLTIKAGQGERFPLPLFGRLAERITYRF